MQLTCIYFPGVLSFCKAPHETQRWLGYYPVISKQKKTDMKYSRKELDGMGIHMEKNRQKLLKFRDRRENQKKKGSERCLVESHSSVYSN